MILKDLYYIPNDLIDEALVYADLSKKYTSNRHDFHSGGLKNKQIKMFEGKLGEKAFKMFLMDNHINFKEDTTSYKDPDIYDFKLPDGTKIDVKTRTKTYHIRTLEMVEQDQNNPKDIYVSAFLNIDKYAVNLLGWYTRQDMHQANHIENQGYLDNYVMYDNELRPIEELFNLYLTKFNNLS